MTDRQRLEKQLDELVSHIVRRRDLIHGCITCGQPMIYETASAGHFIHRSHRCVRWSLVNVNAQCYDCQRQDNKAVYESAMIRKYGEELTQKIKEIARNDCKHSVADLREFYRELKEYQNQLI